ncbi:MAG: hypothetical protein AABZ53_13350 [Planctomycetota bacterium]
MTPITRRNVLIVSGLGAGTLAVPGWAKAPAAASTLPWPGFPQLDPKMVAETVGKSHFDEKRVRELVGMQPALVNAWWDWGFGDWESPLGAASHTGRREIAEFLIDQGARIDIFAAAMLGYTDVVKGLVAARPGIQRTLGPHAITLLAHAEAGGDKSKDTFDYLMSLGDAGKILAQPIGEDERKKYIGTYQFGDGAADRFEIKLDSRGRLVFAYATEGPRMIHSLGNNEFFPAGVPTTKFTFDLAKTPATLTIKSGADTISATRLAS